MEPDIFSTRDNEHNARRRRQVLPLYQIGALTNIEWQVDNTTTAFLDRMVGFAREGNVVDMAEWIQYYTFDAIGALTVSCMYDPTMLLLTMIQFGKPFGFLEQGADVADMISVLHGIGRYGALMGVVSEWHPFVFSTLQYLGPNGGIAYLYKFVGDSIANWNQRSEEDKSLQEERSQGGALLETDYLGSLLAKHRRTPETFKVDDANYHMIANIGGGGETTGSSIVAAIYFLSKHPRSLEKLRQEMEELKARSKNDKITVKEAHECSYLQVSDFVRGTS